MIAPEPRDEHAVRDRAAPGVETATSQAPSPRKKMSTIWVVCGVGLVASVLAVLAIAATVPRLRQQKHLQEAATDVANNVPRVFVVTARASPKVVKQTLPGNSQAYRETALYARTNGYLKEWLVDIGDRVTEGQLIATIAAPDLDDQLAQAKANLEQSRATLQLNEANANLAETILSRYLSTEKSATGSVAQLLIDEQRASVLTSKASVVSAQASIAVNQAMVQLYTDLQGFEKIVAPFAGVITARNVDPGTLVTADNPSATRELFHLMQTDPLRVFVDVPQTFSTSITVGETAEVVRPEQPSKSFPGKVTRTANALDPNTRTLLTQIDVPNADDALRPGMYLLVKFSANRDVPTVLIPSAALAISADGQEEVAVLDANNKVQYRQVQLGRDHGSELEVVNGLSGGETVVLHPGDMLAEGTVVSPQPQPKSR
ncbi:MAG TPA: efflux RND transporter periplasmic adaptor subunit [Gemmataceae bacterium]|nr:efflux RND transporter periplasmic adaptor subunit [Gemmataceae bacterium]